MNKNEIIKTVETYIKPFMEEKCYELVDVQYVKEGPHYYLRVFADKEGGITIDDCEIISRHVDKMLNEKDPIENAYILEVSSPGIDRALKKDSDFEKYKGELVDVKLYKPKNKVKQFRGRLKGLFGKTVVIIDEDDAELTFERSEIADIRLAVIF